MGDSEADRETITVNDLMEIEGLKQIIAIQKANCNLVRLEEIQKQLNVPKNNSQPDTKNPSIKIKKEKTDIKPESSKYLETVEASSSKTKSSVDKRVSDKPKTYKSSDSNKNVTSHKNRSSKGHVKVKKEREDPISSETRNIKLEAEDNSHRYNNTTPTTSETSIPTSSNVSDLLQNISKLLAVPDDDDDEETDYSEVANELSRYVPEGTSSENNDPYFQIPIDLSIVKTEKPDRVPEQTTQQVAKEKDTAKPNDETFVGIKIKEEKIDYDYSEGRTNGEVDKGEKIPTPFSVKMEHSGLEAEQAQNLRIVFNQNTTRTSKRKTDKIAISSGSGTPVNTYLKREPTTPPANKEQKRRKIAVDREDGELVSDEVRSSPDSVIITFGNVQKPVKKEHPKQPEQKTAKEHGRHKHKSKHKRKLRHRSTSLSDEPSGSRSRPQEEGPTLIEPKRRRSSEEPPGLDLAKKDNEIQLLSEEVEALRNLLLLQRGKKAILPELSIENLRQQGIRVDKGSCAAGSSLQSLQDLGADKIIYDGGEHFCRLCAVTFQTLKLYVRHLYTSDHKQKSSREVPWENEARELKAARAKFVAKYDSSLKKYPAKGAEFLVPCRGFYCSQCKLFLCDASLAEVHVLSAKHYELHKAKLGTRSGL